MSERNIVKMDECFLNDVLGNNKQNKKTRRLAYIPSKEKKRINQELLKKKKKKKGREREEKNRREIHSIMWH